MCVCLNQKAVCQNEEVCFDVFVVGPSKVCMYVLIIIVEICIFMQIAGADGNR